MVLWFWTRLFFNFRNNQRHGEFKENYLPKPAEQGATLASIEFQKISCATPYLRVVPIYLRTGSWIANRLTHKKNS